MNSKSGSIFISAFSLTLIFLPDIFFGLYLYELKSSQEYLIDIRSDEFMREIRRAVDDPQFCAICGKSNAAQNEREKLEELRSYCKNHMRDFQLLNRKRRSIKDIHLSPAEKGERGQPGLPGNPGGVGNPGPPGATGPMGPSGNIGSIGPVGPVGAPGFKGERGEQGLTGLQGNKGDTGQPGLAGVSGKNGENGQNGLPGIPGLNGQKGELGIQGLPGAKGDMGLNALPGEKGNTGMPGSQGDLGNDGEQGKIGIPGMKGDAGHVGLTGVPGLKGDVGRTGNPGLKGEVGIIGSPGMKGDKGELGLPGQQGLKDEMGSNGLPGAKGEPGLAGKPGVKGEKGDLGSPGMPGLKGDQGNKGIPGENGAIGSSGFPGLAGINGEIGKPGSPGIKGEMGAPGPTGPPGRDGEIGKPGLAGIPGKNGEHGRDGTHGIPGMHGEKGERGPPGTPAENGECSIDNDSLPLLKDINGVFHVWNEELLSKHCKQAVGLPGLPGMPGPQGSPGLPASCEGILPETISSLKYGDQKYPGLPARIDECTLINVDKGEDYLTVLVDSNQTYWKTDQENSIVNEYRRDQLTRSYELYPSLKGDAFVTYQNSFFYQADSAKPRIIKYFLNNETSQLMHIPGLTAANTKALYAGGYNFLDFNVDENGIWVIFAVPNTSNTGILKMDGSTMTIENIFNTTINHQLFEEMFVVSGVLYGMTKEGVHLGFDLYTNKTLAVDLDFPQAAVINWVRYDHLNKQLLVSYDTSDIIKYPIKCEK